MKFSHIQCTYKTSVDRDSWEQENGMALTLKKYGKIQLFLQFVRVTGTGSPNLNHWMLTTIRENGFQ